MSTSINSNRHQVVFSDHHLSEIDDDLTSIIDRNLLKEQLRRQRQTLFSIIERLIKTELSYAHVVPRLDHEKLFSDLNQLNEEYDLLKEEYQHLGHACLYLINKTQDLLDERDKYYQEWQTNQSLLTPRPDWDKVSNVIDGGFERWKILATGKSSEQLKDLLIKEIINGNQTDSIEEQDYFEAMGDELSVVPFLRTSKDIRITNRRMRRHMTGLLVKEIWSDKNIHSQECLTRNRESLSPDRPFHFDSNQSHKTLADHVADYFEKRFNSKTVAIEMGYNLRDACLRYRTCPQINSFWGILTGQIEEMVYHHQMKSISQLLQHLIRMKSYLASQQQPSSSPKARKAIVSEPNSPLSQMANRRYSLFSIKESTVSHNDLVLTNDQFLESLKLFYPNKTSVQIEQLFQSAKYDLQYPTHSIDLSLLFIEDNEGRFGQFLSTLIQQINQEKLSYVEEIKPILLGYPLITVSQFCRAIYMIDPKIPLEELHRYVKWVFTLKDFPTSEPVKPLDLEDLLRRLENCACFKH